MKILFPYMARWYSLNWSRYHSLLIALAQRGHEIHVLQPPALQSQETNFVEITPVPVPGLHVHDVQVPNWLWRRRLPFDKLFKKALVSICSVRQARRLAREHGITHVMLYNIPQAPLARLPGVSTVFDYADDYMDMLRHELGRMSNPLIMGFARGLLNYMFRNASLVTTVSHVLAEGNAHTMTVLPMASAPRRWELCRQPRPCRGPARDPSWASSAASSISSTSTSFWTRRRASQRWISCSSAKGATTKVWRGRCNAAA